MMTGPRSNDSFPEREKSRVFGARAGHMRDALLILGLSFVLALGLRTFVIGAYRIPSHSMETTLLVGDRVLVNKLSSLSSPRLGDVIAFELLIQTRTGIKEEVFIKRCAGVPGDTVRVAGEEALGAFVVPRPGATVKLTRENIEWWRGVLQHEGHAAAVHANGDITIDGQVSDAFTVHGNYYFGLGDNVSNSSDSREWGLVPEDRIIGKVVMIYWSLDETMSTKSWIERVRWRRVGEIVH